MALSTIRDVRDAMIVAEEATRELAGFLWWRGHGSAAWELLPRVYRPPRRADAEQQLALHFQGGALTRRAACPPADDHPNWLFLMQHYGLPTRLLDWTEAVLTGLFFAVDEEQDAQAGALWALNADALGNDQVGRPGIILPRSPNVRGLFDAAFDRRIAPTDKIIPVGTPQVDIRMMMQVSAFTVHDSRTPLNQLPNSGAFVRKYEIPGAAKPHIREQLALMAIRRANLFPDLDNLAKERGDRCTRSTLEAKQEPRRHSAGVWGEQYDGGG
jgi:hypothetical protein